MIAAKDTLGIGIYTPEEAAFYARVPTRTLNRWIFGDSQGAPVVRPQFENQTKDDRIVTFLDLVQALAIHSIRSVHKIPLGKIRTAVDLARQRYNVQYPFAMKHTTFLFSDGMKEGHGEIVLCREGDTDHPEKYIQISGKERGNYLMNKVVELYLDDLYFDPETGFATKYRPWSAYGRHILLDPKRRFGEPIVEECGYTVETLQQAAVSEGSIESAAETYGVAVEDVKIAFSYWDHLSTQNASPDA